jgi:hypothetical protein
MQPSGSPANPASPPGGQHRIEGKTTGHTQRSIISTGCSQASTSNTRLSNDGDRRAEKAPWQQSSRLVISHDGVSFARARRAPPANPQLIMSRSFGQCSEELQLAVVDSGKASRSNTASRMQVWAPVGHLIKNAALGSAIAISAAASSIPRAPRRAK